MRTPIAYSHAYDLTLNVAQRLAKSNADMTFCYFTGAGTDIYARKDKASGSRHTPIGRALKKLSHPVFRVAEHWMDTQSTRAVFSKHEPLERPTWFGSGMPGSDQRPKSR
ncbi:MAG TPA: hypothetical protein VGL34_01685 [Steroidobacteraceae bacterium]|jgi:hypothetical protein